jgi:hypothetical protein
MHPTGEYIMGMPIVTSPDAPPKTPIIVTGKYEDLVLCECGHPKGTHINGSHECRPLFAARCDCQGFTPKGVKTKEEALEELKPLCHRCHQRHNQDLGTIATSCSAVLRVEYENSSIQYGNMPPDRQIRSIEFRSYDLVDTDPSVQAMHQQIIDLQERIVKLEEKPQLLSVNGVPWVDYDKSMTSLRELKSKVDDIMNWIVAHADLHEHIEGDGK